MADTLNYIDGQFQDAIGGDWLENIDPATANVQGRIAASTAQDIDNAVSSAKRAYPEWSNTPPTDRGAILDAVADGIESRLDELADAESLDSGKPVSQARTIDIPRAAANFRFFAGAVRHDESDFHATSGQLFNYTLRQPLGVVGCISPWNLPLYLFSWKIAPALATGNTVVGKPSELTPRTARILCEISADANLPAGVLNVVHGRGSAAGAPLVEHEDVRAISFTGGTDTGRDIARRAAPDFRKVSLEMGGKNPTIVFEDADLEAALPDIVRASFANQGEICLCGSRILVHRSLFNTFRDRFVDRVKTLRVGDPRDAATDIGALISERHMQKVLSWIETARNEGGQILSGGERVRLEGRCRNGYFVGPTVIGGLDSSCSVNQEEIFGPVTTLIPFESEDEAVAIANSTRYGLAASVWTNNLDRAHRLSARLDAGIVWVNCWMERDLRTPFGGMKSSGLGREGGRYAIDFFTEPKNICIRLGGG